MRIQEDGRPTAAAGANFPPRFNRQSVPHYRAYSLFEKILGILSESLPFLAHVDCFLRPLAVKGDATPDYRVGVFCAAHGSGTVQFCCPELGITAQAPNTARAWVAFRQACNQIILLDERQLVIHGATVADDQGRCAVISGESDAGKTSILLGLLSRGWKYVTDDFSCISLGDFLIRPLLTGCTVSESTIRMYPQIAQLKRQECRFFQDRDKLWTIHPGDLFDYVAPDALLKPTHFFYVYRNSGNQSTIERLSQEDAITWFHLSRFRSRMVSRTGITSSFEYHLNTAKLANTIARSTLFFRVVNGTIDETTNLLQDALMSRAT